MSLSSSPRAIPSVGTLLSHFFSRSKNMNNTSSITGVKVRTHCRTGYKRHITTDAERNLSESETCNNRCIAARDARSLYCGFLNWPKNISDCTGNNNGKALDQCMYMCWNPGELETERPINDGPYTSTLGDKCFNEFITRHKDGISSDINKAEWDNCAATFP